MKLRNTNTCSDWRYLYGARACRYGYCSLLYPDNLLNEYGQLPKDIKEDMRWTCDRTGHDYDTCPTELCELD